MNTTFDDSEQPLSPWQEHLDVFRNIESENRESNLICLQQLWVLVEQCKREKANHHSGYFDEMLKESEALYERIARPSENLQPELLMRLNHLKQQLDALVGK